MRGINSLWRALCTRLEEDAPAVVVRDFRVLDRKRSIVAALICTQILAVLCVVIDLGMSEVGAGGGGTIGAIHYLIGGWCMIGMPALAYATADENADTAELVLLAGTSSTRLARGKFWVVLLLGITVLTSLTPQLLLRYFFGGADLVRDLLFVSGAFGAAMVLTGGVFAVRSLRYVGGLLSIVLVIGGISIFSYLLMADASSGNPVLKVTVQMPVQYLLCYLPTAGFLLYLGAAKWEMRNDQAENSQLFGLVSFVGSVFCIGVGSHGFIAGAALCIMLAALVAFGINTAIKNVVGPEK